MTENKMKAKKIYTVLEIKEDAKKQFKNYAFNSKENIHYNFLSVNVIVLNDKLIIRVNNKEKVVYFSKWTKTEENLILNECIFLNKKIIDESKAFEIFENYMKIQKLC